MNHTLPNSKECKQICTGEKSSGYVARRNFWRNCGTALKNKLKSVSHVHFKSLQEKKKRSQNVTKCRRIENDEEEEKQTKKKTRKWRGSSHKLHCATAWPCLSLLIIGTLHRQTRVCAHIPELGCSRCLPWGHRQKPSTWGTICSWPKQCCHREVSSWFRPQHAVSKPLLPFTSLPVFVSAVIRGLAVWRHNNKKKNKFVAWVTMKKKPCSKCLRDRQWQPK